MRRTWILWGAVLAAAAAAIILLLRGTGAAGPSVLSASARGWLAARAYLERRGSRVVLLGRPLEDGRAKGEAPPALALAFPWQGFPTADELDALGRRLHAGGSVVFAYSGARNHAEDAVAQALGLELDKARGAPPLSPRAWYRFARAETRLTPDAAFASSAAPPVVVGAADRAPRAPKDATVLYRGESDVPRIFSFPRGRGRVLVLPADALSNARIGNPGNADLLESLRGALGAEIVFDEYHHGLVDAGAGGSGSAPSFDLLLAQLAVLYAALAWTLGRRFGPVWEERPEIASSTSGFLLGLGALHRALGHSAAAGRRLIEDAEALDPRVRVPSGLRRTADDAGEESFLAVARTIARLQRRGRLD